MADVSDLVHENSSSTGTGNFTVAAVNGKRTFNVAFGTGGTNVFYYFIMNRSAAEWEFGTGHLSDATTLVRDTVLGSSNSNSAVNFSAGVKDVTNDFPSAVQKNVSKKTRTPNAQTGSSYTLALTDEDGIVTMDNGSANTLEIPPNSSVAFPVCTQVDVFQLGAGQTTIAPGSGVTLLSADSKLKLAARYGGASMFKLATDTWLVSGFLAS